MESLSVATMSLSTSYEIIFLILANAAPLHPALPVLERLLRKHVGPRSMSAREQNHRGADQLNRPAAATWGLRRYASVTTLPSQAVVTS
jgi:hypothetical protein